VPVFIQSILLVRIPMFQQTALPRYSVLTVLVVYLVVFTAVSCTSPFTSEFVVRFMDGVIQHVLRCIQDKERMLVRHSCGGMTTDYTNGDYRHMSITLGACTAAQDRTPPTFIS